MKDNKQLPQIILLGVLLAACLGYATFKMLAKGNTTAQNPPKPVAQAAVPGSTAGGTPPSGAGPAADGKTVIAAANLGPVTRRDPFTPAMVNSTLHVDFVPPRSSRSTRMASAHKLPMFGQWADGGGTPVGAGAGSSLPPVTPTMTARPVEEAAPQFVLTGVITGDNNVAIIRLNENRYIVREGQSIDGEYKVASVTQKSVRLARDGHKDIVLVLGG